MEQFEMRTDAVNHLSVGDIWRTRERGVFVVLAATCAKWRGEDRDVYGHINQWLTCRPATAEETLRWDRAVASAAARRELRKQLGVSADWSYACGILAPPVCATRRLDSYDDRWEPPQSISLTPEQAAIEEEYQSARAALHVS